MKSRNGSETNKQQPNDPNKSGSSNNKQQLETSLDELQSKIDIKRRLINELEINTRSLEVMRVHYEEKMSLLHERIKQMEDERDRVIFNMSKNLFTFIICIIQPFSLYYID